MQFHLKSRPLTVATLAAIAAVTLSSERTIAALETRQWIGDTDNAWNTNANWSPGSAPLAADRIALFNQASDFQPAISTHVTVIGGIWMTGSTVNSMEITSSPTGQNSGAPTFQTNGTTIDGTDGIGILIDSSSGGGLTINTSAFKVGGNQAWINNSSNLFTLSSATNLNGKTVTVSGSGNTLISAALTNNTGTGALTKEGNGTLTLTSPTISYNGATTVAAGTLLVNGAMSSSSAVVSITGGTLGGTGTISRDTTVNSGASINPGTSSAAAGTLTVDRSLTLGGTAAFDILSPSSNDLLNVNSSNSTSRALTFGGTLQVNAPGVSFASGQVYDLFDWGAKTSVTGTFSTINLPALTAGLSWKDFGGQQLDYTTGQIVVVPEPIGGVIALVGLALTARRRRVG